MLWAQIKGFGDSSFLSLIMKMSASLIMKMLNLVILIKARLMQLDCIRLVSCNEEGKFGSIIEKY